MGCRGRGGGWKGYGYAVGRRDEERLLFTHNVSEASTWTDDGDAMMEE